MRGEDQQQLGVFSYVSLEDRVPQSHPLRPIRKAVDEIFRAMSQEFDGLYAKTGRPSIPPERLLRALLLQIFYSIRSERLLMEQLEYNLLFRWFVGMEMDEPVWTKKGRRDGTEEEAHGRADRRGCICRGACRGNPDIKCGWA